MNNPRILFVTEYSGIMTGYGVYAKNLINAFHNMGVDIAEMAINISQEVDINNNTPWKVYAGIPSDPADKEKFDKFPHAEYGAATFDRICLDFKPTHVLSWQDCWHYEHQLRSPFRKFFAHIAMPAVDAEPQHTQWLDLYAESDAILCYTQWGLDLIKSGNPQVNTMGIAPPFCPPEFSPMNNRKELKQQLGLGDIQIIGMVGRNQKRKLFLELLKSFIEYLNLSKRDDVYLYLHTTTVDNGWDLEEEIIRLRLQNKVLFGYICQNCRNIEVGFLQGAHLLPCYSCGQKSKMMTNPKVPMNNLQLSAIYNMLDLYVQWHTNEGYAIPLMEAAACGTPVCGVDYSAVSEVLRLANGNPIKPIGFHKEMESGRNFAVPDNSSLARYFSSFFVQPEMMRNIKRKQTRDAFEKNWNPQNTINTWANAINSTSPKLSWDSPKTIIRPQLPPEGLSNIEFARWLICNVLCEPERIGTWLEGRLVRDLNLGQSTGGFGGKYYHAISAAANISNQPFNRDIALNHFLSLVEEKNAWENQR